MRRKGHGVGVGALRGLRIIRDWVLVPRYKNDLGKHVTLILWLQAAENLPLLHFKQIIN